MTTPPSPWQELVGQMVVLDMRSRYVVLGKLAQQRADCLILDDVDVHDLRDTSTTRERYVLDSRMHGIRPNRKTAWIRLDEVVAASALKDVLID